MFLLMSSHSRFSRRNKNIDIFCLKKSVLTKAVVCRVNIVITVFTLSIRTPYLLIILFLIFEIVHSATC